jgi:Zn2+/Cd2+-exporting ATPase
MHSAEDLSDHPLKGCSCCCHHDHTPAVAACSDSELSADATLSRFLIADMCCANEERLIRNALEGMAGIEVLEFNLLEKELTVVHTLEETAGIESVLTSIGMLPQELPPSSSSKRQAETNPSDSWWLLAVSGAAAIGAEVTSWITGKEDAPVIVALAVISILAGGLPVLKKGWLALRQLSLNINFLMSVAVIGAVALGQWTEAAMVIWLFAIAGRIEARSMDRARRAIRNLMEMAPEKASVRCDSGDWQEREAALVKPGETVRVRAGERIPLDGVVSSGHCFVNQAPITGEAIPVEKGPGDTVFAGTIDEDGVLEFVVSGEYEETTLLRIMKAVQEAQAKQAPSQRLVDRFAAYYTPVVVSAALLVAVVPPLLLGHGWSEWLYKAMVLLVTACPCALVISIPVVVVSGLAAAARHGILIKGGAYLEAGRDIKFVALDKTGTLTRGKPAVTDVAALGGDDAGTLLALAASLDEQATHPIARSIVARWRESSDRHPLLPVTCFREIPGQGVTGEIGGERYYLGNVRLIAEVGVGAPALAGQLQRLEQQGKTAVILASQQRPLAVIGVADTLRDSSKKAIASLHALGVRTAVLSGDNQVAVTAIGRLSGVDEARGNLLPGDKLAAIAGLQQKGGVAMVGDGINDAPALARAEIGMAMGAAGSDVALETADVALMDDDLQKIPDFIRLSRQARRMIVANVTFVLAAKAIFFALTLAGKGTLMMAVFADMGVSLLVVLYSLRILKFFKAASPGEERSEHARLFSRSPSVSSATRETLT